MVHIQTKKVLFLGSRVPEIISIKLAALGHTYIIRNLNSRPINWIKIAETLVKLYASKELLATFLYLPEDIILKCTEPDYENALKAILTQLKATSSLIFINENNLSGNLLRAKRFFQSSF